MHFLLYRRPDEARITEVIAEFLELVHTELLPCDLESTKTGVPRVVTTLRSASRSLRMHGLLSESDRSMYRTWELSVLGAIIASHLYPDAGDTMFPEAGTDTGMPGKFGASSNLGKPIAGALQEFRDPQSAANALSGLFVPDSEVFDSFKEASKIIATFCQRYGSDTSSATRKAFVSADHRAEVDRVLLALKSALEPLKLRTDVARSLVLRRLLG